MDLVQSLVGVRGSSALLVGGLGFLVVIHLHMAQEQDAWPASQIRGHGWLTLGLSGLPFCLALMELRRLNALPLPLVD